MSGKVKSGGADGYGTQAASVGAGEEWYPETDQKLGSGAGVGTLHDEAIGNRDGRPATPARTNTRSALMHSTTNSTDVRNGDIENTQPGTTAVIEDDASPAMPRSLEDADYDDGTIADQCGAGVAEFAVHKTTIVTTLYRQGGKFYVCEEHEIPEPVGRRFCFKFDISPRKARNWLEMHSVGVDTKGIYAARIAAIDRMEVVGK